MPTKTKADYINEMLELGEAPPEKWTITELKVRINELRQEKGVMNHHKGRTELQEWVVRLNRASRKKLELQKFVQEELKAPVNQNSTVAELQKQAMDRIYTISRACGEDPVGFGQHAALSYEELMVSKPDYTQWVLKTEAEGEASPRLIRLA